MKKARCSWIIVLSAFFFSFPSLGMDVNGCNPVLGSASPKNFAHLLNEREYQFSNAMFLIFFPPSVSKKDLPTYGWKVHISATAKTQYQIADRLLPWLRARAMVHKVSVNSMDESGFINPKRPQGRRAVSHWLNRGKFITVYPLSEASARKLALELDRILIEASFEPNDFTPIYNELQIGESGGVFARYGAITRAASDVDLEYERPYPPHVENIFSGISTLNEVENARVLEQIQGIKRLIAEQNSLLEKTRATARSLKSLLSSRLNELSSLNRKITDLLIVQSRLTLLQSELSDLRQRRLRFFQNARIAELDKNVKELESKIIDMELLKEKAAGLNQEIESIHFEIQRLQRNIADAVELLSSIKD